MLENIRLKTRKLFCIVLLSLLVISSLALAEPEAQEDLSFEMSLDELITARIDVVYAASKV